MTSSGFPVLPGVDVDQEALTPYSGWKDAYDDNEEREESSCPDQVRSAQSVTGEIFCWLILQDQNSLSRREPHASVVDEKAKGRHSHRPSGVEVPSRITR